MRNEKKFPKLYPPNWGPDEFPKTKPLMWDFRIQENGEEQGGQLGGSRLGGRIIWGKVEVES